MTEASLLAMLCVSGVFNVAALIVGAWLIATGRIGIHRVYDPVFAADRGASNE